MRCYEYLKVLSDYTIKLEFEPKDLKPYLDIPLKPGWSIDIAMWDNKTGDKIAVELDGSVHSKACKQGKDQDKRMTLEYNGWKVVILNYEYYPKLWSGESGWRDELRSIIIKIKSKNKE